MFPAVSPHRARPARLAHPRISRQPSRLVVAAGFCLACTAGVPLAAQEPIAAPAPTAPETAATGAPTRIVVNLPAFRLDAYEAGRRVASYPVGIGMRRYATPSGVYRISAVDWNPWWRPPASEWARGRGVTAPGPGNPLGRIRLNFMGEYHIHGTRDRGGLGRPSSHGCIRMANADVIALARWIHAHDPAAVSPARLDALAANSRRSQTLPLARDVPVIIEYRTAEVRGETLLLHPNVYGWGSPITTGKLSRTLATAGYAEPLRPAQAAALVRRYARRERGIRYPLHHLARGPLREAATPAELPLGTAGPFGIPAPEIPALLQPPVRSAASRDTGRLAGRAGS